MCKDMRCEDCPINGACEKQKEGGKIMAKVAMTINGNWILVDTVEGYWEEISRAGDAEEADLLQHILNGEIKKKKSPNEQDEIKHQAYLKLSNLYLEVQRGDKILTRSVYMEMDQLLNTFEEHGSDMHNWWLKEFSKLPNWLNV